MNRDPLQFTWTAPARVLHILRNLALAGALVFLAGLFLEPRRTWSGFLMGFYYLAGLAVAGPLFLAFLNLSGGRWARALLRIPEAMGTAIPAAAFLGLVLLWGVPTLYPWADPGTVAEDPILQHKAVWLNRGAFSVRMVLFFVIWFVLAKALAARARSGSHGRILRGSALFIAVFAITWSLASFDWVLSLDPHWFSTIFGLYQLAGIGTAGLAAATVLVVMLRRGPLRDVVTEDHLHDLGELLFCFSIFWVYIWFCQFMLIWYTNIPEEAGYFIARKAGQWDVLTPVNLVLNWMIPFLVLLSRAARRSGPVLLRVCGILLIGHTLDLYLQVAPAGMGPRPLVNVWELGPVLGALALFFFLALKGLSRLPSRPPSEALSGGPFSAAGAGREHSS